MVALLAGILVFLMFVQGGQTLLFSLPSDESEKTMIINSLGRKWEFTFTTLVVFIIPTFLCHQLWGRILAMDSYSFQLHNTGSFI
jgi:cytochrome bd-type quinol oxidase subunit 2